MASNIEKNIRTIGIRGTHFGCGKDTVADLLAKKLTEKFSTNPTSGIVIKRAKFATPLRECMAKLTKISIAESETAEGKERIIPEFNMTVGSFLQLLGTEVIRDTLGEDVLVNALMRRFQPNDFVIISDARFRNEQIAVKDRDGIVVLVSSTRPIDPKLMAGRSLKHASERDLDGIPADYEIKNNSTLEDLERSVDTFINEFIEPTIKKHTNTETALTTVATVLGEVQISSILGAKPQEDINFSNILGRH